MRNSSTSNIHAVQCIITNEELVTKSWQ